MNGGNEICQFTLKPLTNAAYADCGSVSAIFDESRSPGLIV